MSHIKLVVLAFPGSSSFGKYVFYNNGVDHVISFDDHPNSFNPEESIQINDFFSTFYERIFNTEDPATVVEVFHFTL
jgi:hypothetical protein